MTKEAIFEELKGIFRQIRPTLNTDTLTPETRLIEELALDSLTILLLSFTIEQKFGFQFEGAPKFATVSEVIDHIEARVK